MSRRRSSLDRRSRTRSRRHGMRSCFWRAMQQSSPRCSDRPPCWSKWSTGVNCWRCCTRATVSSRRRSFATGAPRGRRRDRRAPRAEGRARVSEWLSYERRSIGRDRPRRPYPATSDARGISVGSLSIERWLRPICYQNVPDQLLPDALKNANPLGILRLINGRSSRETLT